jgi:hypothetical protein
MQSCPRFATYPNFTMSQVETFARYLLGQPIARTWSAPVEVHSVAPSRPLHDVVRPIVVCWREGGFDGDGDELHVWCATEAEAARLDISAHDLCWAAVECITHFRMLSQRMPRAASIQVVVYELAGWILPVVEHAALAARVHTTLH